MKRQIFPSVIALLLATTVPSFADDTAEMPQIEHVSCIGGANEVKIVIKGIKESAGLVVADLYRNDKEGFLKRAGRVAQVRFAAKSPETKFCMRAPEPGLYAMAVYHDENANKTFDRRAFGLPAEPWGISNDPVIRFGPPDIEDTLFDVAKEHGAFVEIDINN